MGRVTDTDSESESDSDSEQSYETDEEDDLRPPLRNVIRKKPLTFSRKANSRRGSSVLYKTKNINIDDEDSSDEENDPFLDTKKFAKKRQVVKRFNASILKQDKEGKAKKRFPLSGLMDLKISSPRNKETNKSKKTVRFSTVDVKTYRRDENKGSESHYTKNDISEMKKQRQKDADWLRKESLFSGKRKKDLTPTLLSLIFDPKDDLHDTISSRGIEQFMYPELRSEISRKQKEAIRQVLEFAGCNPQSEELREVSEQCSKWARGLATKKAMSYAENNAVLLDRSRALVEI